MYEMKIKFKTGGQVSDCQQVRFGIREVTSELTADGFRFFRVNGEKMLILGAGWWSDMLLRLSPERQEAEIRYTLRMNLDWLRMDGKLEDDPFMDLADQFDILLMPGWCCCDQWEKWNNWNEED
jgi:exo-1,4-beta-D-glucosaminidase